MNNVLNIREYVCRPLLLAIPSCLSSGCPWAQTTSDAPAKRASHQPCHKGSSGVAMAQALQCRVAMPGWLTKSQFGLKPNPKCRSRTQEGQQKATSSMWLLQDCCTCARHGRKPLLVAAQAQLLLLRSSMGGTRRHAKRSKAFCEDLTVTNPSE